MGKILFPITTEKAKPNVSVKTIRLPAQETSELAEFKTTADETYDGGKSDLLTITNGSAATDIDITSAPNNSVIQFPAGRYHLLFVGYSATPQVGQASGWNCGRFKAAPMICSSRGQKAGQMLSLRRKQPTPSSGPILSSTALNSSICYFQTQAISREATTCASRRWLNKKGRLHDVEHISKS